MTPKTILVTGATSGIGLEAARALAARGTHVVVGARDRAKGSGVVDALRATGGSAELLLVDVASLASVKRAAESFAAVHDHLDALVNNAGILNFKRAMNAEGHEMTWATNVLGLAALTLALQGALAAAPEPRVVNVGSSAHRSGAMNWDDLEFERTRYAGFRAYAQSKLAVNLWTREFAKRFPNIAANAVHPGAIATNIWSPLPGIVNGILQRVLPTAAQGAVPVVRLATSDDVAGVSGRYFDKLKETPPAKASQSDVDAARVWEIVAREIA